MRRLYCPLFVICSTFLAYSQNSGPLNVEKTIAAVAHKAEASLNQYSMEGNIEIVGQKGDNPAKVISKAEFSFAVGPEGRSFLRLAPAGRDEYQLISNGQKQWAYVSKLKQYTEEEGALVTSEDSSEESSGSGSTNERDLAETMLREVIPHLALINENVYASDQKGSLAVSIDKKKQQWPLLRVMSKPDAESGRSFTELAVDPDSLTVGKMILSQAWLNNGERIVLRMTIDFTSFQMGAEEPESKFAFVPPKNAKRVDSVPIPGQTGSFLLNRPAPDFELKTLDGEHVRLSDLRGKPVLLNFWASWCGPCRRELPELADVYDFYKAKGLVVYGINDEGRDAAREFYKKAFLPFPTLDDSSRKVNGLYRVRSIPTIFLIDREGKVVRFLNGGRDKAELKAALSALGF
jgi:peroxiredoxin/outer membrane lipoprotein-sorting protein